MDKTWVEMRGQVKRQSNEQICQKTDECRDMISHMERSEGYNPGEGNYGPYYGDDGMPLLNTEEALNDKLGFGVGSLCELYFQEQEKRQLKCIPLSVLRAQSNEENKKLIGES